MTTPRIVVALDRSDASRKAAAVAAKLAARRAAQLYVVHAVDAREVVADEALVEVEFARLHRLIDLERAALGPAASHVPPEVDLVRAGHAGREIAVLAEERRADLVITGTRDGPGRRRLLGPSVAGDVVRRARTSVLVVPECSTPSPPGAPVSSHPLAAVDGDDASRELLRAMAALAGDAPIDVVHVIGSRSDPALETEDRVGAIVRAREQLEDWARGALPGASGRLHARVLVGRIPDAIADYAAGSDYDLVGCGIRPHVVSGNTAEALLDAVACPVLVHRPS